MKRFTRWPPRLEMRGTSSHTDLVQQCWKSSNQRVRFEGKTSHGSQVTLFRQHSSHTWLSWQLLRSFFWLHSVWGCQWWRGSKFHGCWARPDPGKFDRTQHQIMINTWLGIAYISLSGSINPSTTEFFFARWRLPAPGLSEEDEIVMTGLIRF